MDKENQSIRYYFITYKEGDLMENDVIDYHPIKFPLKYKDSKIIFYDEISKEQFQMFRLINEKRK